MSRPSATRPRTPAWRPKLCWTGSNQARTSGKAATWEAALLTSGVRNSSPRTWPSTSTTIPPPTVDDAFNCVVAQRPRIASESAGSVPVVKAFHHHGHGHTMVPVALADGSSQGAAATDAQAVGPFLDCRAQAPQLRRHGGDPIALLYPQFLRTADDGFALGAGRRHAEDRKLVDRLGNMLGPDRHPAQGR